MSRADRVLVRDGRRHHRPRYSRTEFRIGLVVVGLLAAIVAWVAREGAHPDPELFLGGQDLTDPGAASAAEVAARNAESAGRAAPGAGAGSRRDIAASEAAGAADRGPLPEGLAADGWTEGRISSFGPDDLYEKINGREGYYKSYGFERLWFVALERTDDPAVVVDVESYDLGSAANAVGAYAGERPRGGEPRVADQGLTHFDRNALLLTRGRFYVRAIGSDESESTRAQLAHLATILETALPGEPLPWNFALFVGQLGLEPGAVSYTPENAFGFGFASEVHSATLADDTEMFVVAAESAAAAAELAGRFTGGFLEYGSETGTSAGVRWIEDRYIRTVAGAKSAAAFTIGVRGAPGRAAAEAALARLETAVLELPEGTVR